MPKDRPGLLIELASRLGEQAKEKKTSTVKAETEKLGKIVEYLALVENILSANDIDVKTLKYWVDSTAYALGRKLAEESLSSSEGKSVAAGIEEIVAIEKEIAESNKILKGAAEMTGISVEKLLEDSENEAVKEIVILRQEKEAQIISLRKALQTYALDLVHTLQEGNQRKLGMSKEELIEWEKKFVSVESMPQDYDSYAERLEQEFVEAKRRLVEFPAHSPSAVDSKERSIAISEKVWGDYAHRIVEILERELPGSENEEKRRHLLAGLLREGNGSTLRVSSYQGNFAIIIHDEVRKMLSAPAVLDIARLGVKAFAISGFRLHDTSKIGGRDGNQENRKAYVECIRTMVALDLPETWGRASNDGGTHISAVFALNGDSRDERNKADTLYREKFVQEVDLANEVDAAIKFLYDGLNEQQQREVTGWDNDYRTLSPVWHMFQSSPASFRTEFSAPVTPDGIFYSKMDEPEESRVSMQQATKKAGAFMQELSSTLNKGKMQHERRPVTPADVKAVNEGRIFVAEQQALVPARDMEEKIEIIKIELAEKTASERRLIKQVSDLEAKLEAANKLMRVAEARSVQVEATAIIDRENFEEERAGYNSAKESQNRELNKAQKKADDAKSAMTTLLDELREAAKKPGVLGGNLKAAVDAILEREQPKK